MTDPLTWSIHELNGTRIGVLDEVQPGAWVDSEPAGRRRAELVLSTSDKHAGDIYPMATVLRAWQGEHPVFAGPMLQPTFDLGASTIRVVALGPRARLESFQIGARGNGEPLSGSVPGHPWRWENVAQGEMFRRLVAYAVPTLAEAAIGIPGHGIVDGTIHLGTLRDREYEPGQQIAELLDQLAAVIGGPDWDIVPIWDPARPWALGELQVLDEAGVNRATNPDPAENVRLEYGCGAETAENFRWMPGGSDGGPVVNRGIGVGDAPEYDGVSPTPPVAPTYRSNQPDSLATFGIWSRYEGFPGVSDLLTLAGHVQARVSTGAFPVDHFEIVPRPDVLTFGPHGRLDLGDRFRAAAVDGNVTLDLTGRVTGAKVETIDETGATRTTLRAAPREFHSVVT